MVAASGPCLPSGGLSRFAGTRWRAFAIVTVTKSTSTSTSATVRPAAAHRAGWRRWLQAVKSVGPGVVTGASDDDPSGIATYAQVGAKFGFGLLWTALITLPLMAAVQEICDRTALATGKTLGELAHQAFGRWARAIIAVLLGALAVANVLNIAADLVAIGAGANLLHAGPVWLWALVAGLVITGLLLSGTFRFIELVFKVLCLALLAYLVVLFAVKVDWAQVALHTVIPHITFNATYLSLLVAVLGTTISPYLFFWQSGHRVEDMREEKAGGDKARGLRNRNGMAASWKLGTSRADVFTGMLLSNLVMFAIITVTAATIATHGGKDIGSAAQAAKALQPVAGSFAEYIFALGFIGSGMLAVPVLAGSASFGLSGLLGKRSGYSRSPRQAPLFYSLVLAGTLGGTALTLTHTNPIRLLVLVALINGIAAAPFLILVMLIARRRDLMGKYRNGPLATTLGWTAVALMGAAALALIATGGGI